ncbi:MAG: MFS transporter [Candidatus Methylacidiphilales bacterium]
MTKTERIMLITLAAINFVNIMDFMIMMPLGPNLIKTFNITTSDFGILVSSYSISAFISGIITTFIINKFERKDYLMRIFIGFLIGTFACGLAPTYATLLVARFATGLFGGVLGAIVLAIVSDAIPFERRGQAMGIIMAAFSLASVLGVPFGIFIATHTKQYDFLGWHAPFLFLAVLGIPVYFLVSKFVIKQTAAVQLAAKQMDVSKNIKAIFSDKNNLLALLFGVVMMMGHFCIIPFLSPYMVSNVGLREEDLPLIYLVGGGLSIFTSPLIGKLADRFGKLLVFVALALLYIIPVYLITNLAPQPLFIVLTISGIFFIFSGRFIPMQAMVTGAVDPKIRASFMSFNSSIQQLANGVSAFLAGLVVTTVDGKLVHYNLLGYFSIGMALLSIFIASKLRSSNGSKF